MTDVYWQNFAPMPNMKQFFARELSGFRLHLDMQGRYDPYDRTRVRESDFIPLSGSPNVKTLKLHIVYEYEPETERVAAFEHLLATCPNVERIDLTFEHQGCVQSGPQPYAFNFERSPLYKAKLAPIQQLKLEGYELDARSDGLYHSTWYRPSPQRLLWPFTRLTFQQLYPYVPLPTIALLRVAKAWLYRDMKPYWLARLYERVTGDHEIRVLRCNYPCCEPLAEGTTNIEAWMVRASFKELTAVEIGYLGHTAALRLLPGLVSLRNLTIHRDGMDPCGRDALFRYIQKPHMPFTALHVAQFSRHLASLTKFLEALEQSKYSLHALTIPSCYEPSPSKLVHMSNFLPNLAALDIHQPRGPPLLTQKVNATHFPSLQSLTIHVPTSGLAKYNRTTQKVEIPTDVLFNKTALESQCSRLTASLTRLELLIGDWARRNPQGMYRGRGEVTGRYVCERKGSVSPAGGSPFQCSGGLRFDGDLGIWSSSPRFIEGPYGHTVLDGEIGEDTQMDEEGRKAGLGRWVQWMPVQDLGLRHGDVDHFGKGYGVDEDWGCLGKCDGSDKIMVNGTVVFVDNVTGDPITTPDYGRGSLWKVINAREAADR